MVPMRSGRNVLSEIADTRVYGVVSGAVVRALAVQRGACVVSVILLIACAGTSGDPVASGPCPPSRSMPDSGSAGAGEIREGGNVEGWFEVHRHATTGLSHGFVLLVRGSRPSDHSISGGSSGSGGGVDASIPSYSYAVRYFSSIEYRTEYDPRSDSLLVIVGGRRLDRVSTAMSNVLLVDRVDGVGGPPTLTPAGCVQLAPWGNVMERARALPAVRRFVAS